MDYCIGDKVKIKPYDCLPEGIKNKGLAKSAGKQGEIVDIIHSTAKGGTVYRILLDGNVHVSRTEFVEETFDLVSQLEMPTYTYEFEYLENLVVARLYEISGDSKVEICKGHGHIFHDGVLGISQAASYALKKIYLKLEEESDEYT